MSMERSLHMSSRLSISIHKRSALRIPNRMISAPIVFRTRVQLSMRTRRSPWKNQNALQFALRILDPLANARSTTSTRSLYHWMILRWEPSNRVFRSLVKIWLRLFFTIKGLIFGYMFLIRTLRLEWFQAVPTEWSDSSVAVICFYWCLLCCLMLSWYYTKPIVLPP
jgi:hypothetical protein